MSLLFVYSLFAFIRPSSHTFLSFQSTLPLCLPPSTFLPSFLTHSPFPSLPPSLPSPHSLPSSLSLSPLFSLPLFTSIPFHLSTHSSLRLCSSFHPFFSPFSLPPVNHFSFLPFSLLLSPILFHHPSSHSYSLPPSSPSLILSLFSPLLPLSSQFKCNLFSLLPLIYSWCNCINS